MPLHLVGGAHAGNPRVHKVLHETFQFEGTAAGETLLKVTIKPLDEDRRKFSIDGVSRQRMNIFARHHVFSCFSCGRTQRPTPQFSVCDGMLKIRRIESLFVFY
jgi:hypothetical protein